MDGGRPAAVKRGALDLAVAVAGPVDPPRSRVERQPQREIQPVPRACVDRVDWPAAIKRSAPDRGFGVVVVDPVDAVGQRGEPIPRPGSEARAGSDLGHIGRARPSKVALCGTFPETPRALFRGPLASSGGPIRFSLPPHAYPREQSAPGLGSPSLLLYANVTTAVS